MEENENAFCGFTPLSLALEDTEWPFTGTDHTREIARAVVFDGSGFLYFCRVEREDIFGPATAIETSGGGVEPGETPEEAIRRELREELGAETEVLCELGTVRDYYNLIRRRNVNHYFLCRVLSFGEKRLTREEREEFRLSTLRLRAAEAEAEYERCACSPWGRLLAQRELPVLRLAAELLRTPFSGKAAGSCLKNAVADRGRSSV